MRAVPASSDKFASVTHDLGVGGGDASLLPSLPPSGAGVFPRTGLSVGPKSCSRSPSVPPSRRPPEAGASGAGAQSPPPGVTAGPASSVPSQSSILRDRTARFCTLDMGRAGPGTSSGRVPQTFTLIPSGVSASGDRNAPDLAPGEDAEPASHDPCGVSQGESRYGESRSHWSSGFSAEGADAAARADDSPAATRKGSSRLGPSGRAATGTAPQSRSRSCLPGPRPPLPPLGLPAVPDWQAASERQVLPLPRQESP